MRINVPDKVRYIIKVLNEHGHEAYAVGGCVRDSILNREPGDWDITTSASPYEVKELFHRTIDTGIQHGTVTVMLDKDGFEVTTYRLDGEYEDCRHPKQVEFTKSLEEDLKRRDFTINAMAYNDEEGMVDLFQGLEDIKAKSIRCVGNPLDRFEEDALRILRAVRFSSQIDFEIEEKTKEAIAVKAPNLVNISAERIRVEFNKLFLSRYPEKLQIAYETGITKVVLPEFDHKKNQCYLLDDIKTDLGEVTLRMLKEVSNLGNQVQIMYDRKTKAKEERYLTSKEWLALSYAVLLASFSEKISQGEYEINKHCEQNAEQAKQVMKRLKFDNETIDCVTKLVLYSCYGIEASEVGLRRAMNQMGKDLMDVWFLFQQAAIKRFSSDERKERKAHLDALYTNYQAVLEKKQCVCMKELNINGKDLIQLGCEQGVKLGELLGQLLQYVIENPEENTYERLVAYAQRFL